MTTKPLQGPDKSGGQAVSQPPVGDKQSEVKPPPSLQPAPPPRQPRIGIILGPGGMRTHAHLGVLQELERARIPIDAIVGIEWGSMIGALYSVKGSGNDAEWKLFKMRDDVVSAKSLFSLGSEANNPERLNAFIKEGFGKLNFQDTKVDFSCPAVAISSGSVVWQSVGPIEKGLRSCIPYPPLYKPNDNMVAAAGSVLEAVQNLTKKKVDIIILIDVLGASALIDSKTAQNNLSTQLLWFEARNRMREAGTYVHEVVSIDTGKLSINDFESRRGFLQLGRKAGQELSRRLSRKYGL